MLIVSGTYHNAQFPHPAYLAIDVLNGSEKAQYLLAVEESDDEPQFYLQTIHPSFEDGIERLNLNDVSELLKELQYRFEEIKTHSINSYKLETQIHE